MLVDKSQKETYQSRQVTKDPNGRLLSYKVNHIVFFIQIHRNVNKE